MSPLAGRVRLLAVVALTAFVLNGCGPSADPPETPLKPGVSPTAAAGKSDGAKVIAKPSRPSVAEEKSDEVSPTATAGKSDGKKVIAKPSRPSVAGKIVSSSTDFEKPYVEVLLGREGYEKVASKVAKGTKAKFEGRITLLGTKRRKVEVEMASLYEGDDRTVQAADLTKDFVTDRTAAEKKYKREAYPPYGIIVEGTVAELRPDDLSLILAGHDESEDPLAGSWIVSSWVMLGSEGNDMNGGTMLFKGGKSTFTTKDGKDSPWGAYRAIPDTSPSAFDLLQVDNASGHPLKCIYSIKDDVMRLCMPMQFDRERPKEFVSTKETETELLTLKRKTR